MQKNQVQSSLGFSPFGMPMPQRTFSAGYRYGFNGQEKDDEIKGSGNSLDFGARIYDSRLGRLLSLDPLSNQFPSESNYSFSGNNPILFVDVEGKKKTVYLTIITKTGKELTFELVNQKDIRISLAATLSETAPNVRIKDIHQSVVIDLSKGTTSISEEKVAGTYSMKLSEYASNAIEGIDNMLPGNGGTQSGGFRLVSLNGENAGADPTKMKIDPETARDLKTLNFDDIAVAITAVGSKGKGLFNDLSSGIEVLPDIVNNAKDMTQAVQDMDPNSTYQMNAQKTNSDHLYCESCNFKGTVKEADSLIKANPGQHTVKEGTRDEKD